MARQVLETILKKSRIISESIDVMVFDSRVLAKTSGNAASLKADVFYVIEFLKSMRVRVFVQGAKAEEIAKMAGCSSIKMKSSKNGISRLSKKFAIPKCRIAIIAPLGKKFVLRTPGRRIVFDNFRQFFEKSRSVLFEEVC